MIEVEQLVKEYRVHSRESGLRAALRSVLRRRYRAVRAVADVSFQIAAGERVGFLGPNGAGKTTTIKVLAGLLVPSSGHVRVAGFVPSERRIPFLSSVMLVTGQKNQLLWDLPPADTFELNRAIYDIPRTDFQERLAELTELLEISEVMLKPTRQLSLGERMKCELAAALLHRPRVLFLDEPTIGLDVTMQATVRRFIRSYNERHGATVLLTSHNMEDIAAICQRVLIINHGQLIYEGTLSDLVRSARDDKHVRLSFRPRVARPDLERFGAIIDYTGDTAVLRASHDRLRPMVEAVLQQLPVTDLTVSDPPIEEVLSDIFKATPAPQRPPARAGGHGP